MSNFAVEVHPEADREFDRFLAADRDTQFDLGEHFRRLEALVSGSGSPEDRRAVVTDGSDALYRYYGSRLQMFVARRGKTLSLVHIAMIGTEHEQNIALERAAERMREYRKS